MLPLSSLILPRTRKLTGSLFLTHWKSCFWIVMETEGIPKGLEPSLDPCLLCWLLCACPVPVLHPCKALGLSWPGGSGKWLKISAEVGSGATQFFLSLLDPLGNAHPSGLLFCVCPSPPGMVWVCRTRYFTAFHSCLWDLLFLVRSWGTRWSSPKAGKGRESWF